MPRSSDKERSLPHNIDAERALLGAIVIDNGTAPRAREILGHADFYRDRHRTIFRSLCDLLDSGRSVDLVVLRGALDDAGKLEEVGGAVYVAGLLDGVPRSANVEDYARIVKEKAIRRELIGLGEAAWNGHGPRELASRASEAAERLSALGEAALPALAGTELAERIASPEHEGLAVVHGLIEASAASLCSGPAKSWKTTIAVDALLSVAARVAFAGRFAVQQVPTLHLDAEMGERRSLALYRRLARGEGVDVTALARGGMLHYIDATRPGPTHDPRSLSRLVRERGIGLMLVDPVVAIFRGDENVATDVREWWGSFVRPLLEEGAAVLLLHHTRKGSLSMADTAADSARGSGDWRGAPDLHAGLRTEPGDRRLVRVDVTGSRLGPEPEPFVLRVEDHDGGLRVRFAGEVQEAIGKTAAAADAVGDLIARAGEVGLPRKEILSALSAKYARRTLEDALALVKNRGTVEARRDGRETVYRRPER